jgi:hypothetical protein
MIYTKQNLLPKLTHLTLAGQEEGYLQFIGDDKQWLKADAMEGYMESGELLAQIDNLEHSCNLTSKGFCDVCQASGVKEI